MQPLGLMRVMAPFMSGMMRNVGFLANLRRVIERD